MLALYCKEMLVVGTIYALLLSVDYLIADVLTNPVLHLVHGLFTLLRIGLCKHC